MTKEERKLWYTFLRKLPVKFVRQKALGCYVVDFYCPQKNLALELDGSQHFEEDGERYDVRRDAFLKERGISVYRISNYDVAFNYEQVKKRILYYLELE